MYIFEKVSGKFYASLFLVLVTFFLFNFNTEASGKDSIDSNAESLVELKKEKFNITNDDSYNLVHIRELYGLDDTVIAHYYNIYVNKKLTGFVLAANDERLDAILEFGNFDENIDTKYGEILEKNTNQKAFYLGLDEIEFSDSGESLKAKLNDRLNGMVKKAQEAKDFEGARELQRYKFGLQYKQKQDQIQTNEVSTFSENTLDITPLGVIGPKELPITRVWQRLTNVANPDSSCGPATGAMITNYYKTQGYSVRDYNYYSYSNANLINHLYFDMNSSLWGTNAYSFANGLKLHLNHDMTGWNYNSSGAPTFGGIQTAINGNNPVGAVWLLLSGENYHWRLIHGYDTEGGNYVGYKDPDGGQYNTSTNYVSWTSISDKINTVYMSR